MFLLVVITSFVCIVSGADEDYDDRIIKGKPVPITEAPFIASLQNDGIHFCGGSIISTKMILTAGHCIRGVIDADLRKLTARVGCSMWSTGGQLKNIIGMKIHPSYNFTTKDNDVGLIKLSSPITLGNQAPKIIKLADGVPGEGKFGRIFGWGLTKEKGYTIPLMLKTANVTSISRKNCSQPPWDYGSAILPSMICANGKGQDACQGDSGGPYVNKASDKLWGVVSWGRGCGRENYPGVFAAVVKFKKWIEKNLDNF